MCCVFLASFLSQINPFPEFSVGHALELEVKEGNEVEYVAALVVEVGETTVSLRSNDGSSTGRVFSLAKNAPTLHPIHYCEEHGFQLTLPKGVNQQHDC